jgi:hypothetical protein
MDLEYISALAKKQLQLEQKVVDAEAKVKEAKEALDVIAVKELPTAMEEAEIETITLDDGSSISVKPSYQASISKANEAAAFKWLKEHKLDGLIKHEVKIPFAKGEEKEAKRFLQWAQKNLKNQAFTDKKAVHAGTLKAFVREQIENGENLPMELFGVFKVIRAVIKEPKV